MCQCEPNCCQSVYALLVSRNITCMLDNLVFPLKSNLKVWPCKRSILDLMWFSRLYDTTPVYAVMSPVFLCMHTVTTVTSVFKGFEYFQLLHIVTGARFNLPEKQEPSLG